MRARVNKAAGWTPRFPGRPLEPSGWTDRTARPGWTTRYTTVGASPPGWRLPTDAAREVHGLSGALVGARTVPAPPTDPDRDWWVTVVRRFLQRGSMPPVTGATRVHDIKRNLLSEALRQAMTPPEHEAWHVDPSIELHPTWEQPFFELARTQLPNGAAFVYPQSPFSAMQSNGATHTAWIDFVVAPPGSGPIAVELDGRQHQRSKLADQTRDSLLKRAHVSTIRVDGLDYTYALDALLRAARPTDDCASDVDQTAITSLVSGIGGVRLLFGIVEAVATGHLAKASTWRVVTPGAAVDRDGFVDLLDVASAFDHLWSTGVLPQRIEFPDLDISWRNPNPSSDRGAGAMDVVILIDWAPTWAALPDPELNDVLVRGVGVPAHCGWDHPLSDSRRVLDLAAVGGAHAADSCFSAIARAAFGVESLRPGQGEAIRRVLSDKDSCVLLPTGHGKTLVYQIAGLCRPGLTLIVSPLTALIADQEERFLTAGIDRVAALFHERSSGRQRDVLHEAVGDHKALFVLVSPERLQIERFRKQLHAAVERGRVAVAVVDETHCVSEWGHDFRTSYLRLGRNLRFLCDSGDGPPPILALTGTASPAVLRDVVRELELDESDPELVLRPDDFDRPNLHFHIRTGEVDEAFELLNRVVLEEIPSLLDVPVDALAQLNESDTVSGVVFCPWAGGDFGVTRVQEYLAKAYARFDTGSELQISTFAGSGPAKADRHEVAAAFKQNRLTTLAATKAYGMGVDKPNIRWTTHLGVPSSIEAFAQEAGRAGRDGRRSICALVSDAHDDPQTRALLSVDDAIRRRTYRSLDKPRAPRSDVQRQLFFLYSSFPRELGSNGWSKPDRAAIGDRWPLDEVRQAQQLWDELRKGGARGGRRITIPHLPAQLLGVDLKPPVAARIRTLRDKALQRLATVGVVDDVTIDFGSDRVTVDLCYFEREGAIDDAMLNAADRILPGQQARHMEHIERAPADLDERIKAHLEYAIGVTYEVIFPARLNALREMWQLTTGEPDHRTISSSIAAYLGAGPLTVMLARLAAAPTLDVNSALEEVDRVAAQSREELAGAAARQLEAYPTHPLLLAVRALGEAHRPAGTEAAFAGYLGQLLASVDDYRLGDDAELALFEWLRRRVWTDWDGEHSGWIPTMLAAIGAHRPQLFDGYLRLLRSQPTTVQGAEHEILLRVGLHRIAEAARLIPLPQPEEP